jgi:hypothetical protein
MFNGILKKGIQWFRGHMNGDIMFPIKTATGGYTVLHFQTQPDSYLQYVPVSTPNTCLWLVDASGVNRVCKPSRNILVTRAPTFSVQKG